MYVHAYYQGLEQNDVLLLHLPTWPSTQVVKFFSHHEEMDGFGTKA
jgi:hypothetical protein